MLIIDHGVLWTLTCYVTLVTVRHKSGIAVDFKRRHGEDARKYAMPFEITNTILAINDGAYLGTSKASKVDRTQQRWLSVDGPVL